MASRTIGSEFVQLKPNTTTNRKLSVPCLLRCGMKNVRFATIFPNRIFIIGLQKREEIMSYQRETKNMDSIALHKFTDVDVPPMF